MQQKKPPWLWPHFEKRRPRRKSFVAVEPEYMVWTIYSWVDVSTQSSDLNGCQCRCTKQVSICGRHGVSYKCPGTGVCQKT